MDEKKGTIKYSVAGIKATVGKNAGKVLYHPRKQQSGIIDLPGLAQHMSEHDSKYNEGDIYAVLVQAVKCIKEFAADGYKVRLGALGARRDDGVFVPVPLQKVSSGEIARKHKSCSLIF